MTDLCDSHAYHIARANAILQEKTIGIKGLFDEPVVIQCYTSDHMIEDRIVALSDFLHRMGREAHQGAVGLVIAGEYFEIGFPLDASPPQKRKKQR